MAASSRTLPSRIFGSSSRPHHGAMAFLGSYPTALHTAAGVGSGSHRTSRPQRHQGFSRVVQRVGAFVGALPGAGEGAKTGSGAATTGTALSMSRSVFRPFTLTDLGARVSVVCGVMCLMSVYHGVEARLFNLPRPEGSRLRRCFVKPSVRLLRKQCQIIHTT